MTSQKTEAPMIYSKISEVMGKVDSIGKDRKNASQGYNFRGIDDMYNALNRHLAEAKVFFTSEVVNVEREERQSKSGNVTIYSILTIKFTAYAEDGSNVSSTTIGEAMDSGDKSMNKAMSVAYKYALMQLFCIPTEDQKDTEYETHQIIPKFDDVKWIQAISAVNSAWDIESLKTAYASAKELAQNDGHKKVLNEVAEKRKLELIEKPVTEPTNG